MALLVFSLLLLLLLLLLFLLLSVAAVDQERDTISCTNKSLLMTLA